jgi:hypothetical protein
LFILLIHLFIYLVQTMETLQEDGQLVFLFHLVSGHTSSSYAGHAALKAGLPPDVVHRGKQVCLFPSLFELWIGKLRFRIFG